MSFWLYNQVLCVTISPQTSLNLTYLVMVLYAEVRVYPVIANIVAFLCTGMRKRVL